MSAGGSLGAGRRREKVLMAVQARFHEYGDELHAAITDVALDHFKMTRMFETLGLQTRADLAGQLDTLFFFAATAGEATLLKKIRDAEWQRVQAELAKKSNSAKDLPPPTSSGAAKPPAIESRRSSAPAAISRVSPPASTPAPMEAPPAEIAPPPAAAPVAAPAAIAALEIAPAPALAQPEPPQQERPMIHVPGYSGPERRSGPVDRRTHADRRDALTAIRHNKRFNGERRKQPMGRRAGDVERNKAHYAQKNLLAGVVILKKGG